MILRPFSDFNKTESSDDNYDIYNLGVIRGSKRRNVLPLGPFTGNPGVKKFPDPTNIL